MTGLFYTFFMVAQLIVADVKHTPADYLKKASKVYSAAKTLQVNYTVKTYNRKTKAFKVTQCVYVSDGSNTYSKKGNREMLRNEKYFITVSSESKEIIISEASSPERMEFLFRENIIDSLLSANNISSRVDVKDAHQADVVLSYKNYIIENMVISIDPNTYKIKKTVIHYNPLGKNDIKTSETTFTDIKLDEKLDKQVFDESLFIVKKGKEIFPAKKYTGYTIKNYTGKTSK